MSEEIKEALEKQMQLLSERSNQENISAEELLQLTHAMAEIAKAMLYEENI